MAADQLVGALLLGVALAVFGYYTAWVMVLPFVDEKAGLHAYFPPRVYAIAVPTALLVAFVALVGLFIGMTMLKTAAKPKSKDSSGSSGKQKAS